MDKIKIYKDGKLLIFQIGTRVRMVKDIILSSEDAEYLSLFAIEGEEGTIDSITPSVSIKFDPTCYGVSRTFFIPEELFITDVIAVVEGSHLRLVK